MKNNEYVNLYREAYSFFESAKNIKKYTKEKKYVESYIPYIVNISFACELYLKLILVYNKISISELKKKSHSLKKLYNLLTKEQKNRIYQSFKRPLIYNIEEEIDNIDMAFKDWRYIVLDRANYIYKTKLFKYYFALEFTDILDTICREIVLRLNPNYKKMLKLI